MPVIERELEIVNKYGLHARPAVQLVETANRFNCKVELSNRSLSVDAKSIMSVMRLAAGKGTVLQIVADGEDAAQAVDEIAKLFAGGFGED